MPTPAAFEICQTETSPPGPFVFASPHSGRFYPLHFRRQTRLNTHDLRRGEDCYTDELADSAIDLGAPLIRATHGRAYVDLNRDPSELDPLIFSPPPHAGRAGLSDRVAAGLGVIPRLVGSGMAIYAQRLDLSEAEARLADIYFPYHAALSDLLDKARAQNGWALLVDCHSMPCLGRRGEEPAPDVVLGDRFGASCAPAFADHFEEAFRAEGLQVVRNTPYAGGYCTQRYGQPHEGLHAIQIELSRGLYMNEMTLAKTAGFVDLHAKLSGVFSSLIQRFQGLDKLAAE